MLDNNIRPFLNKKFDALNEEQQDSVQAQYSSRKKKTAPAYLFLLFLGWPAIHMFYLGRTKEAILRLWPFAVMFITTSFFSESDPETGLESIIELGASFIRLALVVWWVVDFFRIPGLVRKRHNRIAEELLAPITISETHLNDNTSSDPITPTTTAIKKPAKMPDNNMLDPHIDYSLNIMFAKLEEQEKSKVRDEYTKKLKKLFRQLAFFSPIGAIMSMGVGFIIMLIPILGWIVGPIIILISFLCVFFMPLFFFGLSRMPNIEEVGLYKEHRTREAQKILFPYANHE